MSLVGETSIEQAGLWKNLVIDNKKKNPFTLNAKGFVLISILSVSSRKNSRGKRGDASGFY